MLLIPATLPWLFFIPVALVVALVAGFGPGLLAAAVATLFGIASLASIDNPAWLTRPQWIAAALFPLVTLGVVLLAVELREAIRRGRALNARLAEREAFLSSVLAASTDCVKVVELDGTLSFMSEGGMRTMEVCEQADVQGRPWPDFMKGEGVGLARGAVAAARLGRSTHFEAAADTYAGTPKWWSVSVSPIRGEDGKVARILSVSRDHTALRQTSERQQVLTNELGHRLKNVLALVQAIANQTLRDADDLKAASAALSSRLASLGQATDVLTATSWAAADLRAVADAGLSAIDGRGDRVAVSGPPVTLDPQAALGLTLAFHELATNATKYGALSNDTGTVALDWSVAAREGEKRLSLSWRERGGPPVSPPTRKGFGSRLIERLLQSYVQGETALSYLAAGVEFRIEASLGATV